MHANSTRRRVWPEYGGDWMCHFDQRPGAARGSPEFATPCRPHPIGRAAVKMLDIGPHSDYAAGIDLAQFACRFVFAVWRLS